MRFIEFSHRHAAAIIASDPMIKARKLEKLSI